MLHSSYNIQGGLRCKTGIASFLRGASVVLVALCSFPVDRVCGQEAVTTELVKQRGILSSEDSGRLMAVMEKARNGNDITIAAIGGSITAGGLNTKDPKNRYVARTSDWFSKTFPSAKVRFVNAGIGGTNSVYGAMRIQKEVLSQKPDLVIVEFAVNDKAPPIFWDSYEGVLRQILREPQKPAVIELFFMHRDGDNQQAKQEMLGRHYRLPMVSFRDAWWPEITTGRAKWEDLYDDVVHPKDKGQILASELLTTLLDDVNQKSRAGSAAPATVSDLPAPMISDTFEHCRYAKTDELKPTVNSGWAKSPDGKNWESPATDGSIEFGFSGKVLFVGFEIEKGAEPFVTYSIDGGAPQPLKSHGDRPPLADNLAMGEHRVRIDYTGSKAPQGTNAKVRIWGVGAAGAPR